MESRKCAASHHAQEEVPGEDGASAPPVPGPGECVLDVRECALRSCRSWSGHRTCIHRRRGRAPAAALHHALGTFCRSLNLWKKDNSFKIKDSAVSFMARGWNFEEPFCGPVSTRNHVQNT